MADLNAALQLFDATEGNLKKLMDVWSKIEAQMPTGPAFGRPPEYDELCFTFRQILPALPAIDGFRVEDRLLEYDEVGQMRLDAAEIGEIEAHISVERAASEQGRQLQQYRLKLHAKRRELARERIIAVIDEIDNLLPFLRAAAEGKQMNAYMTDIAESEWSQLKELVAELDTLIGSGERPSGWSDMQRHLHFRMVTDLQDIQKRDWPAVKTGLHLNLYADNEPVPVAVTDSVMLSLPVQKATCPRSSTGRGRGRTLSFFSFANRQTRTLAEIPRPVDLGFAVSPDERLVLYSQIDHVASDLMLVENFR